MPERGPVTARRHGRPFGAAAAACAVAILTVACFQAWELSGLRAPDVRAETALIPPGACVVTDEISLVIAANRFTALPGDCPGPLDSLATTLVADHGASVQGGALAAPGLAAVWEGIFSRAGYVWLTSASGRRIPWSPALLAWFSGHFLPLTPTAGGPGDGGVYRRR
jgi:hypothetical protein